jgi:hypothetical protein
VVDVRRLGFPGRRRARVDPSDTPVGDIVGADGIGGLVFSLVLTLFGGVILLVAIFASEALLLIGLVIPILAIARILWVLPWTIAATSSGTVLGVDKVRGWRDSSERIREIAAAYERGQDPFAG